MHIVTVSRQVYMHLLSAQQMMTGTGYQSMADSPQEESSVKSNRQVTVRDELLNRACKFLGVINSTFQRKLQIQGLFY